MDLGDPNLSEKLKLVALHLAILEKVASGLGMLGFNCATVVLLGGFAAALESADFYIVAVILLVQQAGIFSWSQELDWQHQTTWSLTEAVVRAFRFLLSPSRRSPSVLEEPMLPPSLSGRSTSTDQTSSTNPTRESLESHNVHPRSIRVFEPSSMRRLRYWLQIFFVTACVVLSSTRLAQIDYGDIAGADKSKQNLRRVLNIFYGLSLAQALIFLAKKTYLVWMLSCSLLLGKVTSESDIERIRVLFFYDAYSCFINESIFDGMKMDIVSFSEKLLVSGSRDEQLIGAGVRLKFADKAMGRIGMSELEMERLVRMLNWTCSGDKEIRTAAALVVSRLAGEKRNEISLTRITGAMDSITTLLDVQNYESTEETMTDRPKTNYYHTLNFHGLSTLEKLSNDPNVRIKIGETKNLISKIIYFTKLHHQNSIADTDLDFQTTKLAFQILKLLVCTTGPTGKSLRRKISAYNVIINNIDEIHSRHDEILKPLKELGNQIISCLKVDDM